MDNNYLDLRTSEEVSEAFFSASNGNLEMLNNMLGTTYKTFDEAMKGIQKNQGGLVSQMSTTLPGLMSTIQGKIGVGLKNIVQQFQGPLTQAFQGIIGLIDNMSPKLTDFAGNVAKSFESFSKSETAKGLMEIFGTACKVVWNGIKAVIQAVSPIIKSIFKFIGEHSTEISNIVKNLGSIWSSAWKLIGKVLQTAWAILEPILDFIVGGISKISDAIKGVCDWADSLKSKWDSMVKFFEKNPIIATIKKVGDSLSGGGGNGNDGRNAFGSGVIRRNGEIHELHSGEKILTKQETNRYLKGNDKPQYVINVNGMVVREETDIDKIASAFVRKINEQRIVFGGA